MKAFLTRKVAGVPLWIPLAVFVVGVLYMLSRRRRAREEEAAAGAGTFTQGGYPADGASYYDASLYGPVGGPTTLPQFATPSLGFFDLPGEGQVPTLVPSSPSIPQQGGLPITDYGAFIGGQPPPGTLAAETQTAPEVAPEDIRFGDPNVLYSAKYHPETGVWGPEIVQVA